MKALHPNEPGFCPGKRIPLSLMVSTFVLGASLCGQANALWGISLPSYDYDWSIVQPVYTPPTLEQCQNPDFLPTATDTDKAECETLLTEDVLYRLDEAIAAGTLETKEQAIVDPVTGRLQSDPDTGLAHEWVDQDPEKYELTSAFSGSTNYFSPEFSDGKGLPVNSCEGYAAQRYGDFVDYIEGTRDYGNDFRLVFDYAYQDGNIGAAGLAGASLMTADGYVIEEDQMVWPVTSLSETGLDVLANPYTNAIQVPKNEFFALTSDELAYVKNIDEPLYNKLITGRSYYQRGPSTGWHWHATMADRLAEQSDAEMLHLRRKREAFSAFMKTFRQKYGTANDAEFSQVLENPDYETSGGTRAGLSGAEYQYQADSVVSAAPVEELYDQGRILVELLRDAEAEGCLDISPDVQSDYNRCDWSPKDFHDELAFVLESKRQAERLRCINLTTTPDLSEISTRWKQSTAYFDRYLDKQETRQERQIQRISDGLDEPPWYSRSWSDDDQYGWEGELELKWDAHANWDLFQGDGYGLCNINPHIETSARALVSVLGMVTDKEIISAQSVIDVRKDLHYVDLKVMGNDLFTQDWEKKEGEALLSYRIEPFKAGGKFNKSHDQNLGSHTFPVFGVPVTIGFDVVGTMGLGWNISSNASIADNPGTDACPIQTGISLAAAVKPTVTGSTRVYGMVGANVLGAGGEGTLDLVKIGLPLKTSVSVKPFADTSEAALSVNLDSKLDLSTLSGKLSAFIKVLKWKKSKALYSWNGASSSTDLFDFNWDMNLSQLESICTRDAIDCSK